MARKIKARMAPTSSLWRHLIIAAALALLLYAGGFWGYQTLRTRQGPWEVTFLPNHPKGPAIEINQPRLEISEVTVVFADFERPRMSHAQTVVFDKPKTPVPFGEWVVDDLMILPGTVVLEFDEYQVELLPRTLIINGREHGWPSGETIVLRPETDDRPPPSPAARERREAAVPGKTPPDNPTPQPGR